MAIALKRAYEAPSRLDGMRILVDRLWPRGITKQDAQVDLWLKDLAPSDELRKWFHERPSMWLAFRQRYLAELKRQDAAEALDQLSSLAARKRKITLVFSSRNEEHNNAVVLKELLEGMKKPPHKVKRELVSEQAAQARARR